jgi:hypothetical protein
MAFHVRRKVKSLLAPWPAFPFNVRPCRVWAETGNLSIALGRPCILSSVSHAPVAAKKSTQISCGAFFFVFAYEKIGSVIIAILVLHSANASVADGSEHQHHACAAFGEIGHLPPASSSTILNPRFGSSTNN